jgi:hypothetical protein
LIGFSEEQLLIVGADQHGNRFGTEPERKDGTQVFVTSMQKGLAVARKIERISNDGQTLNGRR